MQTDSLFLLPYNLKWLNWTFQIMKLIEFYDFEVDCDTDQDYDSNSEFNGEESEVIPYTHGVSKLITISCQSNNIGYMLCFTEHQSEHFILNSFYLSHDS